VKFLCWKDQWS